MGVNSTNTTRLASTSSLHQEYAAGDRLKYTRLEVSVVLALIASGETIEQVVQAYALSRLTPEAVREAIRLADQALVQSAEILQPAIA